MRRIVDPTRRHIVEGEPGIFPPGFAHPWRTVRGWFRRKREDPPTEDETVPPRGPGEP